MNSAEIIAVTQPVGKLADVTVDEFIAYVARVSNPSNQNNSKTAPKLIKYLLDNSHVSPLDMANVVMEINTTRDIARQALRHTSAKFQEFCVHGDTIIKLKKGKIKIKDMLNNPNFDFNLAKNMIKVYDEQQNRFVYVKIKEVFDTSVKQCFRLTLDNGRQIICSADHKFFVNLKGFIPLKDITTEDFIGINGELLYQNREYLLQSKQKNIINGKGLQGIADDFGMSYNTIRKWLKIHKISFTKKEVSLYTDAWNKGIDKTMQPMYGKYHDLETREKMRKSSSKKEDCNLYRSAKNYRQWRLKVSDWCKGFHTELMVKQNYKCVISGVEINRQNSQVDHILPVSTHPHLAFDVDNLQILHKDAHLSKTKNESSKDQTIRYSKVKSIEEVGEFQTYDLEVDHESHNYVANGIVSHNSQRYQNVGELGFTLREARLQDKKNRQNSIEVDDETLKVGWIEKQQNVIKAASDAYNWALGNGIALEQARVVLPEGLTMSRMYMNGTVRTWIFYLAVRLHRTTQKEHRELAYSVYLQLKEYFPSLQESMLKMYYDELEALGYLEGIDE